MCEYILTGRKKRERQKENSGILSKEDSPVMKLLFIFITESFRRTEKCMVHKNSRMGVCAFFGILRMNYSFVYVFVFVCVCVCLCVMGGEGTRFTSANFFWFTFEQVYLNAIIHS